MVILATAFSLAIQPTASDADELIKAPGDLVQYKLSNLQDGTGLSGDGFSFDYTRTREGDGYPRVVLQTNRGEMRVLGAPIRIENAGTVNLRNMFGRVQSLIDPDGDDGMAIYFVVDEPNRKQFLVSNIIRMGAPKVKVSARPLTEDEMNDFERRRIAKLPPPETPAGHVRSESESKLVPGVPILYGSGGAWKSGTVVDFPSQGLVRIKPDDANVLHTAAIKDWTAVSEENLTKSTTSPKAFSNEFRTLQGSNLVLEPNHLPLTLEGKLLPGTPLFRELHNQWKEVYYLSSDTVAVRTLSRDPSGNKIEFIPYSKLVITTQDSRSQKDKKSGQAFAKNIAGFEKAMTVAKGLGSTNLSKPETPTKSPSIQPKKSKSDSLKPHRSALGEIRIWSDQTGVFEIEAQLVERDGDNLLLKRADNRTVSVPIQSLSAKDKEYVESLEQASMNPFNNFVDMESGGRPANGILDYQKVMQPQWTIGDLSWGPKSLAISPDNQSLLIGRKAACASLVDLKSGQIVIDSGRMNEMGDIGVCEYTPDGSHLILGGDRGLFQVYKTGSDQQLEMLGQFPMHNREITSLSLSRDGKTALSGDIDKMVRHWEIETGTPLVSIDGFEGKIKATCISADGRNLMATDGKTLKIFSVKEKRVTQSLSVGRSHASGQAAAFSTDGTRLAVGDVYKIDIWNVKENRKEGILEGTEINWSMRFTPDNRYLLSGGNGCIYVWDCESMSLVQTNRVGKNFYVQTIGISADGTLITTPSAFSEVTVLSAAH